MKLQAVTELPTRPERPPSPTMKMLLEFMEMDTRYAQITDTRGTSGALINNAIYIKKLPIKFHNRATGWYLERTDK